MVGIERQVSRWQLALIIAAPFVAVWMFSALNPLLALFVMLVILDIGALIDGADSRAKGDWRNQ
jgi:hypothetical protein